MKINAMGINWWTDLYPARIFINVDLPAPDGPIIAANSLERNFPSMPFKMVL